MAQYRHTQRATLILSLVLGTAIFSAGLVVLVGRSDGWAMAMIPGALALVMLALAYAFASLTVEVTRERVTVSFGPGWIHRRFEVREIREATPVRNRWWYGWGIRITPHGWLYNVSGFDAVEVALFNDKRIRIGTDDSATLADAINRVATQPAIRRNAE